MEQQLPTRLREWQVAEFVEDDKVLPIQIIGQPPLASGPAFGLQLVDQIDDIEEPTARTITDAGPSNGDGKVALPGTGRTRGILPNITTPMGGSFIGITLATVRAWRS